MVEASRTLRRHIEKKNTPPPPPTAAIINVLVNEQSYANKLGVSFSFCFRFASKTGDIIDDSMHPGLLTFINCYTHIFRKWHKKRLVVCECVFYFNRRLIDFYYKPKFELTMSFIHTATRMKWENKMCQLRYCNALEYGQGESQLARCRLLNWTKIIEWKTTFGCLHSTLSDDSPLR